MILKNSLALASLCLFVFALWCYEHHKFTAAAWNQPVAYYGDCYAELAWLKAVAQGDGTLLGVRYAHRLAAPGVANWANFPMYEKPTTAVLGLVARHSNLAFASNIGLVAARVTAAAGFWLAACLILKCCPWWSWVGAFCFSQLYYQEWRGLNHLMLGFTWSVPLFVAATWAELNLWWLVVIGFLVGISNPYWVLGGLILLVVCHKHTVDRLALLTGLVLGFVLSNLVTILYSSKLALLRTYQEHERFALRPVDLVLPPIGGLFRNVSLHFSQLIPSWQRGELFSPYLGIVEVLALGLLIHDWITEGDFK